MAHRLPLLIADERRGDNGDATSDRVTRLLSPARRAVRKTCADKTAASRGDRSRAPAPRSARHSVTRVTTVESTARRVSGWLNALRKGARNRATGGSPVREGAADIMATTTKTMAATNGSRDHELQDDARGPPPRAGVRSSGQDSRRRGATSPTSARCSTKARAPRSTSRKRSSSR